MEKNYYDILEISRVASQEIVEKAYKTLAKKYHPDLQEESNKKNAEEKMKELNEAYDVISNPEKRKEYDIKLDNAEKSKKYSSDNYYSKQQTANTNTASQYETGTISKNRNSEYSQEQSSEYDKINEDIIRLKREKEYLRQQEEQLRIEQERQKAIEKAYYDAYIQEMRNRGYKIRYKKSFKDYIQNIGAILVAILLLVIIYQIPFVKNICHELYEENELVKIIVDIFIRIIKEIFNR